MKTTKYKIFAILLLISILFSTYGCVTLPHTEEPETQPETRADGLVKQYCQAPLDANFRDNQLIVSIFPEYNSKEYTIEDFADIKCIEVENILHYDETKPRTMTLTIEGHSKRNVLNAIKVVEQRSDVYRAQPNFIYYLQEEPNDSKYVSNQQWAIDAIDLPEAWDITTDIYKIYIKEECLG